MKGAGSYSINLYERFDNMIICQTVLVSIAAKFLNMRMKDTTIVKYQNRAVTPALAASRARVADVNLGALGAVFRAD